MKKREKIRRICLTYPPFEYNDGFPLMSINRQFQWLKNPSYCYPLLASYAATLLKREGYTIFFIDAVARNMDTIDWFSALDEIEPQLIFFDVRTPTVNYIWDVILTVKNKYEGVYVVLAGDHVTSMPEESMINSKADFIITGGDYERLLLSVVRHINFGDKLENGIFYRSSSGNIKNTGKFSLDASLDGLPFIDRNLTGWKLYSKRNEYFKRTPGTFIMSGRGSKYENHNGASCGLLFYNYRVRNPINVADEIEYLNKRFGIREIMDSTALFPTGEWLSLFCETMRERKLNDRVYIDCNMYLNLLCFEDYTAMKKSGFKTLIFDLPSINLHTTERLGMDRSRLERIVESIKLAKKAGLSIDVSVKIGYPSETEDDIMKTFNTVKNLMFKGYADSINASIFVPYPNTPTFDYCKENGLIKTENWFDYDMRKSVIKLNFGDEKLFKYVEYFYNISFHPLCLFRRIASLRDFYDLIYHIKYFRNVLSHIKINAT